MNIYIDPILIDILHHKLGSEKAIEIIECYILFKENEGDINPLIY